MEACEVHHYVLQQRTVCLSSAAATMPGTRGGTTYRVWAMATTDYWGRQVRHTHPRGVRPVFSTRPCDVSVKTLASLLFIDVLQAVKVGVFRPFTLYPGCFIDPMLPCVVLYMYLLYTFLRIQNVKLSFMMGRRALCRGLRIQGRGFVRAFQRQCVTSRRNHVSLSPCVGKRTYCYVQDKWWPHPALLLWPSMTWHFFFSSQL